jgi:hypothetical protein
LFISQRVTRGRSGSLLRLLLLSSFLIAFGLLTTAGTTLASEAADDALCPLYPSPHLRMGVNVAKEGNVTIDDYDAAQIQAGWYHDYNQQLTPSHPAGMIYHQMLRTSLNTQTLEQSIGPLVDANPGTIWVLGNEPDHQGQDNMTPAAYAVFYHDVYTFLKARDATSRVAVASIVQATPIRLRYLDMVLAAYEERYGHQLPTDVWTLHGFNLPERCGWGAGIPPGLADFAAEGVPCLSPYSEHGNIETFKARLRAFRQWMSDHGYRDHPLILSEYGILLTPFHGFSYPIVRDYMTASFDFMLNTTDSAIGYPADSNRLVQQFAWFSLNYYAYSPTTGQGLNGNLFDHGSRTLLSLGKDYANYAEARTLRFTDLWLSDAAALPVQGTVAGPITLQATVSNGGGVAATNVIMRFWDGTPTNGGQLLGTVPVTAQALPDCAYQYSGQFVWTPTVAGTYTLVVDLQADNLDLESTVANNSGTLTVVVEEVLAPTATASTPTPTGTPTPSPSPTASGTATPTAVVPDQRRVVVQPGAPGELRYTAPNGQQVVVTIAGDAVDQPTTFEVVDQPNPTAQSGAFTVLDQAFTITARQNGALVPNFVFLQPVVMQLQYSAAAAATIDEDQVALYYYNPSKGAWQQDGITLLDRDPASNCLRVLVAHLTEFALLTPLTGTPTPTSAPTSVPGGLYLPLITNE